MNRREKKVVVEKIRNAFSHKGAILARFMALNSEQIIEIKKMLWEQGINCMVMKNSLAKIVVDDVNLKFLSKDFSGSVLVFYSEDLFSLMKFVSKIVNDHQDCFVLLCGKYLNEYLSIEFIKKCSSVSSVQSFYAQLLLTIASPLKGLQRIVRRPLLDCSKCLKVSVDKQSVN